MFALSPFSRDAFVPERPLLVSRTCHQRTCLPQSGCWGCNYPKLQSPLCAISHEVFIGVCGGEGSSHTRHMPPAQCGCCHGTGVHGYLTLSPGAQESLWNAGHCQGSLSFHYQGYLQNETCQVPLWRDSCGWGVHVGWGGFATEHGGRRH